MIVRILLAAPLLAAVPAGAAAPDAAAETAIRTALAGWVAAANRGDYEAALAVWAPDLVGWPPEGPDDSYARELAASKLPPQPVRTTFALSIDEVIVDGSLAVVRDTWTQTTKRDGPPDKVETFRSFEVWRRQPDASWKISRWIDGPVMPAGKPAG
jgi:ketosteroid isomerase-like protein